MIANVLFATTILFIALLFFLVQECAFLIPYRRLLIEKYGSQIALYAAAVFFNVFAGVYVAARKLFLAVSKRYWPQASSHREAVAHRGKHFGRIEPPFK